MKYSYVLMTGLMLLVVARMSLADQLQGDYSSIVGTHSSSGFTWTASWVPANEASFTAVNDSGSELIGYTGSNYSGIYLGTIEGEALQDSANLSAVLKYFLNGSSFDVTTYLKVNNTDGVSTPDTVTSDGVSLTVSYNTGGESGTWVVTDNNPAIDYFVDFYVVKAGNYYALYYVDPALLSGTWSTEHILVGKNGNNPEISHLVVALDPQTSVVPEPATMLLFGTGIAGLAGITRRKRD